MNQINISGVFLQLMTLVYVSCANNLILQHWLQWRELSMHSKYKIHDSKSDIRRFNDRASRKTYCIILTLGPDNPYHNITFHFSISLPRSILVHSRWKRDRPRLRVGVKPQTSGVVRIRKADTLRVSGWAITLLPNKLRTFL